MHFQPETHNGSGHSAESNPAGCDQELVAEGDRTELAQQHDALGKSLEAFSALAARGLGKPEVVDGMRDLLMTVSMHFGFEESVMQKLGYPEFDHHMRQHIGMITELGLLLDSVEDVADQSTMRKIDFLVVWYKRHADLSDHKLNQWMALA